MRLPPSFLSTNRANLRSSHPYKSRTLLFELNGYSRVLALISPR